MVSTGHGLIGNNTFVYCDNYPTNCVDPSGESPFGTLELWDYYLMHKYVQYLCVAEYGWDMEVYVKGPLGRGSLDLYDYESNTYYEVKTKNTVNRAKSLVDAQMAKYDSSQIKARRYKEAYITDSPSRGTQFISGTFCYGIYDVSYTTKENGLIVYDPVANKGRSLQTAVVLVMAVCVALGRVETAVAIGAYASGTA